MIGSSLLLAALGARVRAQSAYVVTGSTYSQHGDGFSNWPTSAPAPAQAYTPFQQSDITNRRLGGYAHCSATINPLNRAELFAIGSTGVNSSTQTFIDYFHSSDGGRTWDSSTTNTIAAFSDNTHSYRSYPSPAVAYRTKPGSNGLSTGDLVAVVAAYAGDDEWAEFDDQDYAVDLTNGIYFFATSASQQNATNPRATSDWTAPLRIEQNADPGGDNSLAPHVGAPVIAVDNNVGGSQQGTTYLLWVDKGVAAASPWGASNNLGEHLYTTTPLRIAAVGRDNAILTSARNVIVVNNSHANCNLNHELEAGSVAVGPDGTVFISWLEHVWYNWDRYQQYGANYPNQQDSPSQDNSMSDSLAIRDGTSIMHIAFSKDQGQTFTEITSTVNQIGLWEPGPAYTSFNGLGNPSGSGIDDGDGILYWHDLSYAGFYASFTGRVPKTSTQSYNSEYQWPYGQPPRRLYYTLPAFSTPMICVGTENSGRYNLYVTWADRGGPAGNGGTSYIKLGETCFDEAGGAFVAPSGSGTVFRSLLVSPNAFSGTTVEAWDPTHRHTGTPDSVFRTGPCIAVDHLERIYISYYAHCIYGDSILTKVIVYNFPHGYEDPNAQGSTVGHLMANDETCYDRNGAVVSGLTHPYERRQSGVPSRDFLAHTWMFGDVIIDPCGPDPQMASVVWTDGRDDYNADPVDDNPKRLCSQLLVPCSEGDTANTGTLIGLTTNNQALSKIMWVESSAG